MNPFKRFKNLIALAAVLLFALALIMIGAPPVMAAMFVGCWQLIQITKANSRRYRRGLLYTTVLSEAQIKEFGEIMESLKGYGPIFKELDGIAKAEGGFAAIKALPETLKKAQQRDDETQKLLGKLQKQFALRGVSGNIRWVGNQPFVSDECARAIAASVVLQASALHKPDGTSALRSLTPNTQLQETWLAEARAFYGIEQKAGGALSPTDIPLPTIYMPQVIELVFAYGQARQFATVYPLGAGTVKLPQLQAGEDTFGFTGVGTAGMSQAIALKEVTANLVTFTANKCGGLIRIPTELEEDTFIALGQFLARYIARQLAKLEDNTLFNADGTATYANIIGIGKYCTTNVAYLQQLAAGKTIPTQATINDFRAMRARVNAAVLFNMAANGQTSAAYYMHPTMEALLVTFNTLNNPFIYERPTAGNPAKLDGFPIRWIGVSQPYSTAAEPSANLAFFGDLSYWFLGERGSPRIEVSREVFFATDELAMRALERIDVEAMAVDAMATLQTPAQ